MAFNVNDIKSKLVGGGARPALFSVQFDTPGGVQSPVDVQFMVKAAQMPAATLGTIEIPYFGRKIKIAGDRTFAEWTVTVINDENFLIRNPMEEWMSKINSHQGNRRQFGTSDPINYKQDAEVTQYSKTGDILRTYKFVGAFPTEVSTIDLDWNTTDAIEEFTVTFQYDYWEISQAALPGAPSTAEAVA